jgi:hypothetical protein
MGLNGWPTTAEDEESWYPHYEEPKRKGRVTWPVAFTVIVIVLGVAAVLMKYGLVER